MSAPPAPQRGDRWQTVEAIFHDLADLEAGPARDAVVLARCGGDPSLVADVQALLAGDAFAARDVPPRDPHLGLRLGAYRIEALIARGGMAAVYSASRADDQFQQRVAIKIMDLRLSDADLVARFKAERQLLATLEHPALTRLLDGGVTPVGEPYLVMEFVDGVALDQHCDRAGLDIAARVRLFTDVCAGVAFAHGKRVVHRDLKPSNILVTADGHVKVVDFGTATLLEPDRLSTVSRAPLTPAYASPEQLTGQPVGTASDQYSLGLVLYELLTGAPAFSDRGSLMASMERALAGTPPTTLPDAVTAAAASARATSPSQLRTALQGDLEAVVSTALSPAPADRYPSVDEMAVDLQRWLAGVAVTRVGRQRATGRARTLSGVAAVLLSLAVVALTWPLRYPAAAASLLTLSEARVSIAVLPVSNLTSDPTLDAFIDVLADDMAEALTRATAVRVTARTSTLAYRSTPRDIRAVGAALGVQHVVEGTVTRSGTALKVTLRATRTSDGAEVWASSVDTVATDMFVLAQQAAVGVLGAIDTRVDTAAIQSDVTSPHDARARDAYAQGRHFTRLATPAGYEAAKRAFEECIRTEPAFGRCHSGWGVVRSYILAAAGPVSAGDLGEAERAMERAVELEPGNATALANLGGFDILYRYDWPAARAKYLRAVQISPRLALEAYAGGLALVGRLRDAEALYRKALEWDPLSLALHFKVAGVITAQGRFDDALAHYLTVDSIAPGHPATHYARVLLYAWKGDVDKAQASLDALQAVASGSYLVTAATVILLEHSGRHAEALHELQVWEAGAGQQQPYLLGACYAQLKRPTDAAKWLLVAIERHDPSAAVLVMDWGLEPIRRAPEFRTVWRAVPKLTVDAAYPGGRESP